MPMKKAPGSSFSCGHSFNPTRKYHVGNHVLLNDQLPIYTKVSLTILKSSHHVIFWNFIILSRRKRIGWKDGPYDFFREKTSSRWRASSKLSSEITFSLTYFFFAIMISIYLIYYFSLALFPLPLLPRWDKIGFGRILLDFRIWGVVLFLEIKFTFFWLILLVRNFTLIEWVLSLTDYYSRLFNEEWKFFDLGSSTIIEISFGCSHMRFQTRKTKSFFTHLINDLKGIDLNRIF